METQLIYELIGYLASVLIAVSLMMSSIIKLRVINLLGSITFTVYGLLITSYPVAAMNLFIAFVNIYYLRNMLASREYFTLLKIDRDSEYLCYFLDFYDRQIRRFQPRFSRKLPENGFHFFVLRDMIPAGLFIGEIQGHNRLLVTLDFVIPRYRDFKVGRYLYREKSDFFLQQGIQEIISYPGSREHQRYLQKMGFQQETANDGQMIYRLPVTGT